MIQNYWQELFFLLPELILSLALICNIILGLIFQKKSFFIHVSVLGLALGCALYFSILQNYYFSNNIFLFSKSLLIHFQTNNVRILVLSTGCIVLLFFCLKQILIDTKVEFFALFTAIMIGSMVLAMSNHWCVALLALEIVSISSYVLVALFSNKNSTESAMKYILFGIASSAIMLYGISLYFGLSGNLFFHERKFYAPLPFVPTTVAFTLISVGIFFKLSIVPFHFWVADVYQGAKPAIVAILALVPKLAAIGLILSMYQGFETISLPIVPPRGVFSVVVAWLAVVSITVGNLGAFSQNNTMRMLGYSSIAHAGFLLMPLAFGFEGAPTTFFYFGVYAIVSFAIFYVIEITKFDILENFSGLGNSKPFLAVLIVVFLVGMAGLPPTGGFMAKFFVFSTLYQEFAVTQNYSYLCIILLVILNTLFALYYYLKIPYLMFFKTSSVDFEKISLSSYIFLSFLALLLLVSFFVPNIFLMQK